MLIRYISYKLFLNYSLLINAQGHGLFVIPTLPIRCFSTILTEAKDDKTTNQ